ncbi:MAG: DUF2147 domain-containing protein [Bacteroidota bacterium]|nr:DUF2147 domain-containing protein [Bacteroidota bacterium]
MNPFLSFNMLCSHILFFTFLLNAENLFLSNWNTFNHLADPTNIVTNPNKNADAILGKWMTVEHSLEVEVYKQGDNFRAKVIWFKIEDTTRPMNTRTDEKNPNPALRSRKWLGMEVLRDLKYNAEDDEWQDGIIYDAKHGKEWDSVVWITKDGLLKVKGYWVFKWISETLTFKRVG